MNEQQHLCQTFFVTNTGNKVNFSEQAGTTEQQYIQVWWEKYGKVVLKLT